MIVALGIVIGFIVGALALGWSGGIAGAFTGFIVALAIRSRRQAQRRAADSSAHPAPAPVVAPPSATQALDARLASIERRLDALETMLSAGTSGSTAAAPAYQASPVAAPEPVEPDMTVPPGFVRTPEGTLEPVASMREALTVPISATHTAPLAEAPLEPPRPQWTDPAAPQAPAAPNPVWAWFTSGNVLTRIGVVALFFGIGFLLKYLAEIVTVSIEIKLIAVAAVGAALALVGARLARTRPGYGLSLEGAGAGVLYLTTFAAFRLYDVLPATPAFALLVAIAALTVWMAIREDSQPLAALAIAGGFLAPFFVATTPGEPALLFGYFLVLNAAILALALVRAWRALNVLGFVFTFVLAIFWGERYYEPGHFATVEPFLLVFFVFYVAIAILYAKRGALAAKAPVDGILVFGVPMVALGLQAAIVHDTRYGVAYSALAMAGVYAVLWFALHRRAEPGLVLLSKAFAALAVVLATIAIPFAADPQWTSAWWALESAAVYWIGCRQQQVIARGFALLLQAGAALAFAYGDIEAGGAMFLNATFFGSILVALAAFATAFVADRHRDGVTKLERTLLPFLMGWGTLWWIGAGANELGREVADAMQGNAILGYVVASVAAALALRGPLRWPRFAWVGACLLPMMALVALYDWDHQRSTIVAYGWAVWPLAWVLHWRTLRAADGLPEGAAHPARIEAFLRFLHAASAIALVAWTAWEASEWVGRLFPVGTVWVACAAAIPAVAYLLLVTAWRTSSKWPMAEYADAYARTAGTVVAALLGAWFCIVNVISPGSAAPLPYVPLLNPLDLTLVLVLTALFVWAQRTQDLEERTLYAWFGIALFVFVNAIVFRAVHHWLNVPWRPGALFASKPLQAALTLTWTATALPLMLVATRRAIRPLWMTGAVLLAIVVVKLFAVDLSALAGLPRIVAFLGVGALLLVIGYLAPLPPAKAADAR
ncbi:MAG: DUF2339 domain-containing protein [Burkholderiales bacterium]